MATPVTGFLGSSLVRKFWMALTGLFLITFLLVHLAVNLLSLSSNPELFNEASHFMGTNFLIQVMQYVLAAGFIMHIGTGIYLTRQNQAARPVKYAMDKPSANSSFSSRNMAITGILIFFFLVLHLRDYFWILKFGDMTPYGDDYTLVVGLFSSLLYTALYVVAFILLGIHLHHGFQSSFQSLGARHPKYLPLVQKFGLWYSILVPGGFALIAIWHYINSI